MEHTSLRQRPDWVDSAMFPFGSRWIDIDGHSVHYVDEGRGPVLLMLHGNPTWSFVYRQVIEQLSDGFRCVALDYPGFGLSHAAPGYRFLPSQHAAVVARFVEQLDLRDLTVVAQDWGGPIGVHAAAAQQERVRALVFCNTWAWPVNGDIHFEAFSRLMGGPLGRLAIRHLNLFVDVMVPAGHVRRSLPPAEMNQYRSALPTAQRRQPSAVFPHEITASRAFLTEVRSELEHLADLPSLLAWADKDIAFRAKERKRFEQMLRNHTTVIVEGAGHYVQSDAPLDVARAIREWHGALLPD